MNFYCIVVSILYDLVYSKIKCFSQKHLIKCLCLEVCCLTVLGNQLTTYFFFPDLNILHFIIVIPHLPSPPLSLLSFFPTLLSLTSYPPLIPFLTLRFPLILTPLLISYPHPSPLILIPLLFRHPHPCFPKLTPSIVISQVEMA